MSDFLNMYEFINADEIAQALAPFHPESVALQASKLMINRLKELLLPNKSFAFETTAAGTNYLKYLKEAQNKKYEINFIFLWLEDEELAIERVAQRVALGGHDVPEDTIRRRYKLGLKNMVKYYLPFVDNALIFNNSQAELQKVIARKDSKNGLKIEDIINWNEIQRSINA